MLGSDILPIAVTFVCLAGGIRSIVVAAKRQRRVLGDHPSTRILANLERVGLAHLSRDKLGLEWHLSGPTYWLTGLFTLSTAAWGIERADLSVCAVCTTVFVVLVSFLKKTRKVLTVEQKGDVTTVSVETTMLGVRLRAQSISSRTLLFERVYVEESEGRCPWLQANGPGGALRVLTQNPMWWPVATPEFQEYLARALNRWEITDLRAGP